MSEPLSKIPDGTRYYFGREARARREIEATAMSVFDGWSYEEITTPTIDYYSLFEHGMGHAEAHRAFRFTDADGRLLALRPDVTSGVARAAATLFAERERPLRLCYAARVFRQQGASRAEWRRESTQIGCELLGPQSMAADVEVLAIALEVLECLGLGGTCSITLNDVEIFNGIAESLALDPVLRDEMRRIVDARNAADLERFLAHYTSAKQCEAFARLTQLAGSGETFDDARRAIANGRSGAALDRLEGLWRVIESLNLSDHFEIDLGDVSRLDYYTGLCFEIYVEGAGARVGSGGRYDNLAAGFGKAEPAVGFVLNLDALADVLLAGNPGRGTPQVQSAAVITNRDTAELFREALQKRARRDRTIISFSE